MQMLHGRSRACAEQAKEQDQQFEVLCSYCEVYNEIIYDLLVPNSGPLDLRCAAVQCCVAAPLWISSPCLVAIWKQM